MPAFAVDTFQSLVAHPPERVMVTRGQKLTRKKKAVKKPPKASFARRSAKAHRTKTRKPTKTGKASASASSGLVRGEVKENVEAMVVGKEAENAEGVMSMSAEGLVPAEAHPEAGQSRGKKSFRIHSKTSDARVEVQLGNKLYYVKKVADGLPFDFSKTVSWKKHGGAESAWTHVKHITGWDLPNVD